jgi:hypothetical protein
MITKLFVGLMLLQTPSVVKAKMRELAGFVGTWDARTTFHGRNGTPDSHEVGTYTISWALDSTYLQWTISLGRRSMLILLTYNPVSARYEQTYFYNGSALRVFETAEYDSVAREFRTVAFIPREDGVRDEHVHTTTKFLADTAIIHEHFSRYSDQSTERNDFSATLRRAISRE